MTLLDIPTLEDKIIALSRNVRNQLPNDAASHIGITDISNTPRNLIYTVKPVLNGTWE
jgi:hypothetical protein